LILTQTKIQSQKKAGVDDRHFFVSEKYFWFQILMFQIELNAAAANDGGLTICVFVSAGGEKIIRAVTDTFFWRTRALFGRRRLICRSPL
jgi:hypothetical protein